MKKVCIIGASGKLGKYMVGHALAKGYEVVGVWSDHVGDPILGSNCTRRVDFALFMVAALENDTLIHKVPAIVGCRTPSALAHTQAPPAGLKRSAEAFR